jgi:alginate biosynthesis protein AlgX
LFIKRNMAALAAAVFLSTMPAQAQNNDCGVEEVQALFCPAMKDETLYDKNNFDSYKMLVPGNGGWIFRSESDFRNDFSIPDDTLDDLEELSDAFKAHGTELVMLITPTRALMHSQYITDEDKKKYDLRNMDKVWKSYWNGIESIRNRGITVVGVERPAPETPFFYRKDHHWNPYGAQLSAKALAATIKKLPAYKDIEKIEYATREDGAYDFYGVSKKVFKRICDTRQPPERIVKKVTERKSTAEGQDDLFGDSKQPEIVLMGTSNSTMEPSQANFEGFLKEELSADIINMSVSGGGLDTAMISYLNSEAFHKNPAKIAIWEIPGYYDLSNHKKFFREAIPATYGSCESNPVVLAKDKKIEEKTMIALEKLASRKISGSDYYLNVGFNTPMTEPVTLDLRYVKNRDKYKFDRSGRYPSDGQFYVALQDGKKENLEKVVLNLPEEAKGKTVSVMICKKDQKTSLGYNETPMEPKQPPVVSVEHNTPNFKKEKL